MATFNGAPADCWSAPRRTPKDGIPKPVDELVSPSVPWLTIKLARP